MDMESSYSEKLHKILCASMLENGSVMKWVDMEKPIFQTVLNIKESLSILYLRDMAVSNGLMEIAIKALGEKAV